MTPGIPPGIPTTPAATRALLRRFDLRPAKRWGQHFIASARALGAVLDAADLTPADSVLEVGPGLGTLTAALADAAGWVTAIEVDGRLLPVLESVLGTRRNVRVIHADVLERDLAALFDGPAGAPRKLVANLPYNIAAAVVVRALDPAVRLARAVVTVQREVADRLAASPGSRTYGRLSVAVQFRATPRVAARVPPGAFVPPPDVESSVVVLTPHPRPPVAVEREDEFFAVVAAGFGHRRKTLANSLAYGLEIPPDRAASACALAGVDPRVRAETLDLQQFAALARALRGTFRLRRSDPAREQS